MAFVCVYLLIRCKKQKSLATTFKLNTQLEHVIVFRSEGFEKLSRDRETDTHCGSIGKRRILHRSFVPTNSSGTKHYLKSKTTSDSILQKSRWLEWHGRDQDSITAARQ
mmetsp:Transcript_19163/g.52621  ORF Transcript_19163/g.52621 Transcript_19163/m.52621 type:complete len:109 (-) Transcript_19163:3297-3623(-)